MLNLLAESFRGFNDFRLAALFGGPATSMLLVAALAAMYLVHGATTLTSVLLLCVTTVVAALLFAAGSMRRYLRSPEAVAATTAKDLMDLGWPLMITSLSIFFVTQVDLWIIGASRPPAEVASYGAAARLVQLVMMPMLIVNAVLPPLISELYSQGKIKQLERLIRTAAALAGIPAAVVLAVLMFAAAPVLGVAYGDYYANGADALKLLSAGQLFNVLAGSGAIVLMMTNHQRAIMVISLICGAVLILGGLAAVGPYGGAGVAAAAAIAAAMHAMMTLTWVKMKTTMWTHIGFSGLGQVKNAMASLKA